MKKSQKKQKSNVLIMAEISCNGSHENMEMKKYEIIWEKKMTNIIQAAM